MPGANSIVELVAYERLAAGVTLAPVFQDAPEDQPWPVVLIGDIDAKPFTDDPDDIDARVSLSIDTLTMGTERAPCTDIQDEIEAALRNYRETRDGWALAFRCLGSAASISPDGEGYDGKTLFEVIAFSQD